MAAGVPTGAGFTYESTYFGVGDKKCSAEQFLQAVEAQKATAGYTDVQAVNYAVKFLTGDAASYFKDYYPFSEPAHAAVIARDWADGLVADVHAYVQAAVTAGVAPTVASVRNWFAPLARSLAVEACATGHAATKALFPRNLLLKVVINSLADTSARKLATKMEADKKSLNNIVTALRDRERSKAIKGSPSRTRPLGRFPAQ
jgi:hypothetical protein